MTVWLVFGLMTLAAAFAVLWPLGRRQQAVAVSDADVYRAQLGEVERARALGSLNEEEAASVHAEVARRLIAATSHVPRQMADMAWRRRLLAVLAIGLLPLLAASIYAMTGSPHIPDQPLAARAAPSANEPPVMLISRVEAALQQRPDDGRGWDIIAPIYLRMGRTAEAAMAYANAIRLLGSSPEREAGHGEALTLAAGGAVTEDAREAFQRAVDADGGNARARFYLARAKAQDGDRESAIADFTAMLEAAPSNAPWRAMVERALADLEGAAQ